MRGALGRDMDDHGPAWWGWTVTTTTDTTPFVVPGELRPRIPQDDERIRRIVREEIADLPIRYDVPDEPPEKV